MNVHSHGRSPFVWRRHVRKEGTRVDTVVETNLQIIPQSCLRIAIVPEALHLKKILWCLALLVGIRLSMYREVSIKPRGGETSSGEDNKRLSEPPDATRRDLALGRKLFAPRHRHLVVIKSKYFNKYYRRQEA